ncbi:integrase arm-type DNA-binding domain-containing protein [Trichlorobacter lovleyi]|uniref:tyrosine-type recombinase/integrase n=1 Tax=Trichlorobacter lovleyi TaxID=313985 RepID=UPI0022404F6F|nr:site-specific integrase [Trichlorobacter lovleyi]QOX78371.1 integrase arm-type DNA-binding domain-containing protein [Trichlorobacter lovleyi]
MSLTAAAIDAAKAGEKDRKMFDTDGLFLLVTKKGQKWWRFKYRYQGKEKQISLGTYPEVTLAKAREERNDCRKLVAAGADPSALRKSKKVTATQAKTFRDVATNWISHHKPGTPGEGRDWSSSYATQVENRLERHVLKRIGHELFDTITPGRISAILDPLSPDIQHRIARDIYRVFAYGRIKEGYPDLSNPAADLVEVLKKRPKRKNFTAIIEPLQLGGLLRACDCYGGSFVVRMYLRLAVLFFQRPTELRLARWNEFDLESRTWTIPAARMKSGEPHIVPLADQAVALLEELRPVTRGKRNSLLFPGERKRGNTDERPISDATGTAALADMGYRDRQTVHGFRASARTMLDQEHHVPEKFIELQLDHLTKAPNGTAYDRTSFLPERREMMQLWADYLDRLKQMHLNAASKKSSAGALVVDRQDIAVGKASRPTAGRRNRRVKSGVSVVKPNQANAIQAGENETL